MKGVLVVAARKCKCRRWSLMMSVVLVSCCVGPDAGVLPFRRRPGAAAGDDPDLDPNNFATGLLRRHDADQLAAAEGQVRLPADAPLPAAAGRRRLQRPGGAAVRLRQQLADWSRLEVLGLFRAAQVGVYRTSDRTVQFSAQYRRLSQNDAPGRASAWPSTSTAPVTSPMSSRQAWRWCCRASSATAARSTSNRLRVERQHRRDPSRTRTTPC